MQDFEDSTLWRISAYERFRAESGRSGFVQPGANTVLPSTLSAELSELERSKRSGDALQVLAACMRKRESALILLRHRDLVWPLTLFPQSGLYHLARPIIESLESGNRDLEVLAVEPAGLRPPGHSQTELIAEASTYRHLPPLLWAFALHAPRARLLDDIAGRAAYRVSADFAADGMGRAGFLGSVLQRLRREVCSMDDIARWPGMDSERAARVLNAIYLQGGLIVLRSHQAAKSDQQSRLLRWLHPGR